MQLYSTFPAQDCCCKQPQATAAELIQVIRLLNLEKLRDVDAEEIGRASTELAVEQHSNPKARSYVRSASYFAFVAKKWLRFYGKLKIPTPFMLCLT